MLGSQTIVSSKYLDGVAIQAHDIISEKGIVSVGTLANTIDLSIDYLSII